MYSLSVMTDDIGKVVEKVKKEEMMILDMRDFESYMKGHIPNSILAPYVEGRWAPEISNFLSSRDSPTIVLYESDEEKNVASSELSKLGHELQFLKYKEFKQAGNFQEAHATNLRPDEFGEHIEDYQVIDVREPYEWNSGYIDNAHLIPLNDLFIEYEKLDKKKKYAIICAHGNRSLYGAIFLADKGYEVYNVDGGMDALQRSGYV